MSRRRKKTSGRPRSTEPRVVLSADDEVALSMAIRRSCSECGSPHIHWGDVAGGVWGARTDRQRAGFTEAVASGLGIEWAAWWCMDCSGIGIFYPFEHSW